MTKQLVVAIGLISVAMSLAGEGPATLQPASVPTLAPLETYAALWQKSLFKHSPETPPTEPEPDVAPPAWAAELELCGWTEHDDKMVVYLVHKSDQITIALSNDADSSSSADDSGYRLLQIANQDSYTDMKALVAYNGKSAWIKQTIEDAPADSGGGSPTQPYVPAAVPVAPMAAVTSHLSLTKTPVILDNKSVLPVPAVQASVAPAPETPGTPTMPPTVPVVSAEQTDARLNLINSIRERNESTYRNYPRR
jgi:hypothetical protein